MTDEAWIVFDPGFGDGGKGATVDFLCRDRGADLVVRFNGGAQAGHNVVTADGVHHTFAQFGAGTFAGANTLLGPGFVLHPGGMLAEDAVLRKKGISDAIDRSRIDPRALVISPFQQTACRLREIRRGDAAHGTCGVGVGEAVRDALGSLDDVIRAADLGDAGRKLDGQRRRILGEFAGDRGCRDPRCETEWAILDGDDTVDRTVESWRALADRLHLLESGEAAAAIHSTRSVVFEGAQGVLLDQDHGFHPHTTWSDCTPSRALEALDEIDCPVHRLAVHRSYMVRHGPGPFPTHDPELDRSIREPHNNDEGWQGAFRTGPLDLVLLRYTLEVSGGADGLALNCLDQLSDEVEVCTAYEIDGEVTTRLSPPAEGDLAALEALGHRISGARPVLQRVSAHDLIRHIERELEIPVRLTAHGPTASERRWIAAF